MWNPLKEIVYEFNITKQRETGNFKYLLNS